MAISLNTAGSWAYAASGSVTPTLPTHSTGDMLLVRVAAKSSAIATCDATTATSGWAKVGQTAGANNSGNGTGSVLVAAFWKVATSASEPAPQIDFDETVTQVGHVALSYQKASTEGWLTPVGDGGLDEGTANTSHSATIASHVSVTAADMVDFFTGIRDDTTMTVPDITQASVTYGVVSEQPATAGTDTSGADGAYDGGYRLASSGTSSAAAVVTGTLSTNEQGTSWMTRLRVQVATDANAEVATGTGASFLASIALLVSAALSSGTGSAYVASANPQPNAGNAAGVGAAYSVTPLVEPFAGLSPGTGSAFDATVTIESGTNAAAGLASGTGSAGNPSINLAPGAGSGGGTGSAGGPGSSVEPTAGHASGSGSAYDPSVTTGATPSWGPWSDTYQNTVPAAVASRHFAGKPLAAASVTQPAGRRALHKVVHADLASGAGVALDATTEWNDDETALILLLSL